MTVEKPKPKQLLRPITTGANSAMSQSQFLAIAYNWLKGREKSRVHGAIGFGFASYWLKNWRESFKPITKRSNRNNVITFDSHLKTALKPLLTEFFITLNLRQLSLHGDRNAHILEVAVSIPHQKFTSFGDFFIHFIEYLSFLLD